MDALVVAYINEVFENRLRGIYDRLAVLEGNGGAAFDIEVMRAEIAAAVTAAMDAASAAIEAANEAEIAAGDAEAAANEAAAEHDEVHEETEELTDEAEALEETLEANEPEDEAPKRRTSVLDRKLFG